MNKLYLPIIIIIALIAVLVFYFGRNLSQSTSQEGAFSSSTLGLPEAKSMETVELKSGGTYDLTASVVKKKIGGNEVKMLAYNGSVPGPLVKVPQGAEITINFKNNTDVDSTIHSHGVRADNKFDGVPTVTQDAVKPGESFIYKLKFPDPGIYWYHPHIREDYAQELGLYGNFLVTPSQKDYWAEVDREEALFLDDILMENGQIAPFFREKVDHTLMGRFGNVMLVNGDDQYELSINQGERVRFYLTNAANTRVFNFSIPNTRMRLVGADNGKYEQEEWVDSVIIGPSERAIIEIWFDQSGEYQIAHQTPERTYAMGKITVKPQPVTSSYLLTPRVNEDLISSLETLRALFTKPVDKKLNLTVSMTGNMMMEGMMMGDDDEKIEWEDTMAMMNIMSTNKTVKWKLMDDETKKENADISWQFKKGDKVKLEIFNDPESMHPMQHPIHIHGQKFLVLSTNGITNTNLVWKDTVLVQKGDTVELLVDMENPGTWAFHCHIPEHMESGMMFHFKVN